MGCTWTCHRGRVYLGCSDFDQYEYGRGCDHEIMETDAGPKSQIWKWWRRWSLVCWKAAGEPPQTISPTWAAINEGHWQSKVLGSKQPCQTKAYNIGPLEGFHGVWCTTNEPPGRGRIGFYWDDNKKNCQQQSPVAVWGIRWYQYLHWERRKQRPMVEFEVKGCHEGKQNVFGHWGKSLNIVNVLNLFVTTNDPSSLELFNVIIDITFGFPHLFSRKRGMRRGTEEKGTKSKVRMCTIWQISWNAAWSQNARLGEEMAAVHEEGSSSGIAEDRTFTTHWFHYCPLYLSLSFSPH